MDAIHINWTKPFRVKNNREFEIEDFEILTTILSALLWRTHNGKIKLCADKYAIDFYEKNNLLYIWDEIQTLNVDEDINPSMFWAAGKLFALKEQKAPVAMIDTDFIVWDKLDFSSMPECSVIHFEDLYPDVYPPFEYFNMKKGYKQKVYNPDLRAANTAFAIFKNQTLIDEYTTQAIHFMKNAVDCDDYLKYMVFCEQRLLPICVDALGIEIKELSSQEELFGAKNKLYTHTWGMKQQMRDNPRLRFDFCMRCVNRIKHDFPEMSGKLPL